MSGSSRYASPSDGTGFRDRIRILPCSTIGSGWDTSTIFHETCCLVPRGRHNPSASGLAATTTETTDHPHQSSLVRGRQLAPPRDHLLPPGQDRQVRNQASAQRLKTWIRRALPLTVTAIRRGVRQRCPSFGRYGELDHRRLLSFPRERRARHRWFAPGWSPRAAVDGVGSRIGFDDPPAPSRHSRQRPGH
jgi:hypothetical protein